MEKKYILNKMLNTNEYNFNLNNYFRLLLCAIKL